MRGAVGEGCVAWQLVIVCLGFWSSAFGQVSVNYENVCCGRSIMQSSGLVVIETGRVLATGTYTALRARFCSADGVWIQVWRSTSPSTGNGFLQVELRWQIQVFPAPPSASIDGSQTVTFMDSPLTVTEADRLGFLTTFPTANHTPSYPVPYDTDSAYTLYFSLFPVDRLAAGDHVGMDDLRWPRSFRNYFVFCTNTSSCPPFGNDQATDNATTTTTATTAATTTAGVPVTGQPNNCCANCADREQLEQLKEKIDNQTKVINDLEKIITDLVLLIRNLTSGFIPTGTCPSGFVGGTPGVPNCYLVYHQAIQMAEAALRCSDEHGASLLSIRSDAEEQFLRGLISGGPDGTQLAEYWTAGMFNFPTRTWVWYDESLRTKGAFAYRKWYNGVEPVPADENDVCMTLNFDPTSGQDYWRKKHCFTPTYFICQVPKKCT